MCELIGGSLVEINDADENNFIAGQVVARHNCKYTDIFFDKSAAEPRWLSR